MIVDWKKKIKIEYICLNIIKFMRGLCKYYMKVIYLICKNYNYIFIILICMERERERDFEVEGEIFFYRDLYKNYGVKYIFRM